MGCCAKPKCKRRHLIEIQAPNQTSTTSYTPNDPWAAPTKFTRAKACIEPMSGRERLFAMQLEDTVTHKVTMKYQSGITAKMRVKKVSDSRFFNIRWIRNIEEANEWLEIFCEEGVAT